MKRSIKLDRLNRRILTFLQNNARISNIDLANDVGLSPSACLQRTKALEEAGYIHSYLTVVNLNKICENVTAYLDITMNHHEQPTLRRFEKAVKAYGNIVDCMRMSGGSDYMAFCVCSSVAELNELCEELLGQDLGIQRIDTRIVMDTPKWMGGYPLDDLRWRDGGDEEE
ncbi:Lrp/AsnC family transcriptional regulator [Pseudoteredinibacter isoporae]|uniref:Lrp/AsnC family leucine-responsive transcriptional regulator n=1 Tax=Pseudoteredinibacter isoporae TaxID=570281 RepID=A0A7X0JRV7_9GAMM|nr:Lrp/AsnC family transcriptional regulator [Pseudoteredinibacter isoporae]MBB6520270.1 Lrp/AsnC family leucine-responsive transcriptional regulator [Pseudoteredinibacter isoporae]NHO85841.1 Lrp/AsnC family transcriptional regulator [Pseudoteredinibacter isoporae]NIB25707.1 Lrp/AsnC family transcriptional regulator [Pseudoteredinibacter isoporae]